jgi:hypothetical protein
VVAALLVSTPCVAANRYDWRLRFKTIRTPHFDIHAHQGVEALVVRLSAIAEDVRAQMQPVLGLPAGRVQVILVDQTDLSNGWATPFPYDAIEITAVPPLAETLIGNTDDWLRVAFTHEYTHILHLDRTGGWLRGVRTIFGRVPFIFPNTFLPVWQVEGIATFEESRMTQQGRIPAGDFRAIVDVAARAHQFEPQDRASGGLIDWPGGNAAYAYGGYFHRFLADQYGASRLEALADATARRLPFLGSPAFKEVFGRSVGDLWKEFAENRTANAPAAGSSDRRATRLTHLGFNVLAPRYGADGTVYFAASGADRFPTLDKLMSDGSIETVANRVAGNRTSVRGDWIVFDQVERVRSVGLYSDLYAVRTTGGRVHRLTHEARAGDPDLSPDGRQIACTVHVGGRRALAIVDFTPDATSTPRIIADQPESDFSGPRWSPDGRRLVAERRRRGGGYELVVVDVASGQVQSLVARTRVRLVTPSWLPDGTAVLFAANVDDQPFNIYAVSTEGGVRQITDSTSGAVAPQLSPDGRTLLYVGYTPDGNDLFSVPADPASWRDVEWKQEQAEVSHEPTPSGAMTTYRPWRTLLPTYWSPVLATDSDEFLVGAGTAASDALGRHAYSVDAAWTASRGRPDWHASYVYDRWWPTLFAAYSDDTDPFSLGEVRSRELIGGALLPVRRIRWTETFLGAIDIERDTFRCTRPCGSVGDGRRNSVRGGWIHDSRLQYGYSVSPEEGIQIEAAAESTPREFGSDGDASAIVLDARAFHRVTSGHTVLAGRVAFAGAWGDRSVRRAFAAGGPGPSVASFDFGRDTIGLLRGFDSGDLVGSQAAVANLDLRFPLAYPQRGPGSWPIFIQSVHGALFVDAGNAWTGSFRRADIRSSIGAELSTDIVLGHYLPLTLAGGGAWIRDPVSGRSDAAVFGRVGRAF